MGDTYVAPEYTSTRTAERLNGLRLTNNELILPLDNYQWEGYYFGLLFIPAALFGLILAWIAGLVVASWCKRTVEDNRLAGFVVFFILAVASFFCWIPVFLANTRTNDSIDDVVISIHDLRLYFINVGAGKLLSKCVPAHKCFFQSPYKSLQYLILFWMTIAPFKFA